MFSASVLLRRFTLLATITTVKLKNLYYRDLKKIVLIDLRIKTYAFLALLHHLFNSKESRPSAFL